MMFAFVAVFAAQCISFQPPVTHASSGVQAILVRDVDGDGDADVIASGNQVDEQPAFSLFENRGDGTFEPERLIAARFGERIEDVADLNGDGLRDLLASNYWSNGITIYLSRGSLTFDGGTPYGTATHGGPSLIVGDDVISLSFGSGNPVRVHVFHRNGDGSLGPKTTFDTSLANGASPSIRRIAGTLEILVNERSQQLGIIHYANGGVFVSRIDARPGFGLTSTFADVNGDGVEDIIDTTDDETSASEPLFVTLANSDGSFRERTRVAQPRKTTLPVGVAVADLDGDDRADIVVADFREQNLYWYRGDGAGNFAEGIAIDAGAAVNVFATGDLNGDGLSDLVTANSDHTVSVLLNRGSCGSPRRRAASH